MPTTVRTVLLLLPLVSFGHLAAQTPRNGTFTGLPSARNASAGGDDARDVHGSWGIDMPTGYFFRGIRFEDRGLLVQPYLELAYGLGDSDDGVRSVDLVLGTWNSFHEGPTGTGGGSSSWYESDFYAGLAVTLGERWGASATYAFYSSPNGAFAVSEEATFAVTFDDTALWREGGEGLQPKFVLGVETVGQQDGGSDRGVYAQIGIEPSFALGSLGESEMSLALPVALGCSLGGYYEDLGGTDHTFGFLDVGAVLSAPLTFLPARLGPWSMSLSVHALWLGSTAEEANRGDDLAWIGSLGVSTTF